MAHSKGTETHSVIKRMHCTWNSYFLLEYDDSHLLIGHTWMSLRLNMSSCLL